MIDYIKLICENQTIINKLINFPDAKPYRHSVNVYDGFEVFGKQMRFDFRKVFENGQFVGYRHLELSITPHYHFNNYLHNGNDLTPKNAQKTVSEIFCYLGLSANDYEDFKVVNLEYGLNVLPTTEIKKVIQGIIYHKKTPFITSDFQFNKITDATKQKRIKAYAKGLQFEDFPHYKIPANTFRFEIRNKKSGAIKKLGINTIKDIFKDEVFENMALSIIEEWKQVLLIDLTPNLEGLSKKQSDYIKLHSTPKKWAEIIQSDYRNKFTREKAKYYGLLKKKHSVSMEILHLLEAKIRDIKIGAFLPQKKNNKNTPKTIINKGEKDSFQIAKVVQIYPHARVVNGKNAPIPLPTPRKCIITGIDITGQRKGSLFIREKTLKNLKTSSPTKYNELEKKYLQPQNKNLPEDRQLYLICKCIRDEDSNPRNNRKRFEKKYYPKNQLQLKFK